MPQTGSIASNRGTDTHALIEKYLISGAELPFELSYSQGFLGELRASAHLVLPEHKLAVDKDWVGVGWDSPDAWCRGILDLLIVPRGAKATVYDWKTGKMYDEHYEQKELYAALVFANLAEEIVEVEAIHVYLDLKKNTTRTYHRTQVEPVHQRWKARADKLLQEDYTPLPGWYCRYCSYSKLKGGPCKF